MTGPRGRARWLILMASLGLVLPLLVWMAPSAGAASPSGSRSVRPPGLKPTQVDLTNDQTHRYGEPEIAVNPRNPNNLVYFVMSNMLTYQCEAAGDPNCQLLPLSGTPAGEYNVPGWISTHVFVSFDRGRKWKEVSFPSIPAFRGFPGEGTDHSDLVSMGDPMVAVTANGTFYLGWDSMNLGIIHLPPGYVFGGVTVCPASTPQPGCPVGGLIDGGIAVSKSTNGGRTWSTPVLTGTGVDRPWMSTDLSTGTVYEASSGFVDSSMSTGNSNLPLFGNGISDRWVVSSPDGVHWTAPEQLGGCDTSTTPPTCYSGSGGSNISAAHGVLAATFQATTDAACMFFVGTSAPCTVFETSTTSGATWSRHAVAGLADASGSILVAADPARGGTYTVAALNSAQTEFDVFTTHNSGRTWIGPAVVTNNQTTTKYKPWIDYSPDGVVGLVWRSVVPSASPAADPAADPAATVADAAATVADSAADPAVVSGDDPCSELGCISGLPPDVNDEDPPVGPYTIWAAISYDGGVRFSEPLRISTAPSPTFDPNMSGGTDDTSDITLSNHDVYLGWGDWRPGNVAGFFSAVKIQAFAFPAKSHGHGSRR
jgi:hypothetical protein